MSNPQGAQIRTNYRITRASQILDNVLSTSAFPAGVFFGQYVSYVVRLRQSWQIDSAIGDIISFSMDGYGRPAWVIAKVIGSVHTTQFCFNMSLSASQSLVYASILVVSNDAALMSLGSFAATTTVPVELFALIASR